MNDGRAADWLGTAASVTLADVAGQRLNVLSSVATPLYVVGAFLTHGFVRWLMVGIAAGLLLGGLLVRKPTTVAQAPGTLVVCAGLSVMWGWLAADLPLLAAGSLAATAVYYALIMLRPFAEIGLFVMPPLFLASQYAFGTAGGLALQSVGVVVMIMALGLLLLGIRVTTERRINEHTLALAAANDQLDELNRTDALTGLANRRQLDETLARAWEHARESGRPVGLLMLDIDHFKQYNDHYGHLGGDACLRKVATAVAAGLRDVDMAARYGGEEFSIIVPDADLEEAARFAERVRLEVAGLAEEHATAPNGFLSVSVGVASAIPAEGDTAQELIERADRGLYEAKRHGRNRIGVATLSNRSA